MITLRCSTLFLLLLAANLAYSADDSTNTIASILQSYANAFTTHGPKVDNRPVSSFDHPVPSNYVHSITTIKPDEQRLVEVTAEPSIEVGSSNFVAKNVDPYRADASSEESDENTDPEGPPYHVIPHSDHENPREPSTRPNYTAPGDWAKPSPAKNIPLEFVPTKLYAQVRGTHTVAHLPREEAVNNAKTDEEKENAARLKEVVKISKANTVYTEEGYEDAAYDHAGQIRDADFHEGFARKLNEEHERKKVLAGKGNRPRKKSDKKHNKKSRKSKARQYDNYDDDYRDHLEVIEEARTNKQRIRPEDLKVLKAALQDSVVNPKNVVEGGILRLEEDLRKEAIETHRTSTEPYAATTIAPPVEVGYRSNEVQQEATTVKYDVFTVRPKRPTISVKPKAYVAKLKIPSQYYSAVKNSDYANNGDLTNEGQKSAVSYQPIYSESPTVSPLITNPLALATVNGHGPYLFLVTSPPNPFTSSPLENQELITTDNVHYVASPENKTTSSGLTNAYDERIPFLVTDRKSEITSGEIHSPQYIRNNPQLYVNEPSVEAHFKPSTKFKTLSNHEKMSNYLRNQKNDYLDYYTALQPPKPSPVLSTYSGFPQASYDNVLNQWSVAQESARPIESTYNALPKISRPQIDAELQRPSQPVTRLLPPAPLSGSEYATFHTRNERTGSTTPSLMTIMPIIHAIHKYESNNQRAFPFLLRMKRSALGPSREWEIMQRDLRLQHEAEKQQAKLTNAESTISEKKASNKKFPTKFERLLHESPRIASGVVDKEIRQRFKETSKESSDEASKESAIERSNEESKEELNESSKEHGSVEVEVPELDFSDIFKEDEPEPTTKKPSIDVQKYPFYKSDEATGNTALKYIVNPLDNPRKTLGGMEFYQSRNLECEEIDPNLEKIVPEEEELANKRGPRKNKPRLHGLGDKLDCYKAKYFDENPLDNPIFFEKQIEIPSPPRELDAKKFASRILELPQEKDEYVIQRGPKYPEQFRPTQKNVKQRNVPKHHFSEQNANYNYVPRWQNSGYMKGHRQRHQEPPMFANESKMRSNRTRSRTGPKRSNLRVTPPYQRQVYEDVMGTIMNLENMYKSPGAKRSALPSFSKFHKRENNRNVSSELNGQKKRKPAQIEGLVPPPIVNHSPQKNNKYAYSNPRIRNNYSDGSTQRFKRSVDAGSENKEVLSQTNTNNINNNTNELRQKKPFRIILTTPTPEKFRPTRQAVTIVKDEPTTTTERIIYTINDRIRHSYRNREDLGRYNKFENQENTTSPIDVRRKEPRYNNSFKRNSIKVPTSNITSNISMNDSLSVTPIPSVDFAFSASTIIPVVVMPDKNFTAGLPQETKTRYQKQKLEEIEVEEEPKPENSKNCEEHESNKKEKQLDNSNKQYLVHENIKEDDGKKVETTETTDDGDKIEIITKYSSLPDSKEHKELYEFLKGDPPGYDKAFPPDESPEQLESKKTESVRNAHSKEIDSNDEEIEELDENENDEYQGESTSENPEVESIENSEPVKEEETKEEETKEEEAKEEEANPNKNSQESDNEPFVRYSSRPYSPPENYEDERYSDLGPRINKPYFYHPPFEVPEYEKYALGKTIDRSDNDDWGHEETEDHETYVFPWEANKEDKEDKDEAEESQNYSRYEYPWEKRERKERERRKKEKLRKLNKKMYGHEEENEPEEDETVTRLVYVPLRKKYPRYYSYIVPRGKKNIKPVKRSYEQRPVTKFSSRYKSGVLKVPLDDEEMLITVANNDVIKQSIMNYLQKAASTTPKSKIAHGSHKNLTGNANTVSSAILTSNKTTRFKIENTMLKPPVNLTISNVEKIVSSTEAPISTSAIPRQTRMRSRKAKLAASSETVINLQTSTTPASRVMRRRGRSRGVTSSTTTAPTTAASAKPNRRRSRLSAVSSTTSTSVSSTSRTLIDKRRRPSRSQIHADQSRKIPEIKKNDQSSSTTLSSAPASTGKTIEHHSRVSKEEIITKTITNGDDSDEDDITFEDVSKSDSTKLASEKEPVRYSKVTRRSKPKNDTDEHTVKEKVEKVTITMEETPNHVFKTEEIDKDGVKGKFVTITANNNTTSSRDRNNNFQVKDDDDLEDTKKRIKDFNSFESVIQDSEETNDDSSGNQEAENHLVGNLLQKSPLPTERNSKGQDNESSVEDVSSEDEDADDSDDDYHENNDDDDDNDENEDEENDNDNGGEKSDGSNKKNREENKKDADDKEKPSVLIIKDPSSRRYFYIEQR